MRLRLTLSSGPVVEQIEIRADSDTRWEEIAAALPSGWPREPTRYAARSAAWATTQTGSAPGPRTAAPGPRAPVPLQPGHVVGLPPLLHGATLLLRPVLQADPPIDGAPRHRDTASLLDPDPPRSGLASPAQIRVSEGPDCGHVRDLVAGSTVTIGRDVACDLILDDPALSRLHCSVSATRSGVLIRDRGSTNRSLLEGEPLTQETSWPPGARLHLGGSVLELAVDEAAPLHTTPDGTGRLVVIPTSRPDTGVVEREFTTPPAPEPPQASPPPVLSWCLPLLVSLALAVILRMPIFLLFGLMAPAMMLGSYLGERRAQRKRHARALVQHARDLLDLHDRVDTEVQAQCRALRRAYTDIAAWTASTRDRPSHPLWAGRPGEAPHPLPPGVTVRLGRGRRPASVALDGVRAQADDSPVLLTWTGTLGILGRPAIVRSLARTVLVQVLLEHGPDVLHLPPPWVPAPGAGEWSWLTWAPHRDVRGQSGQLVLEDRLDQPGDPPGPRTGPVLRLARTRQELGRVDHLVELTSPATATLQPDGRHQSCPLTPDLVSRAVAARLIRRIAALRTDTTGEGPGELPRAVRLDEILPDPGSAEAIRNRWVHQPRSTTSVLGRNATGPASIDLVRDGPHGLVAGTTGAGKSELLRTLVTTLALGNRPDELVLVLVDYKGGSAFADCAQLPHCVGMVTDLDPHLADRALTSLGAELTRRERLLAQVGARDLEAYQHDGRHPPIPRLVIVIDEFRALAEELPGFVDGLVRIAALGRSLGVHLVLATQRPAGIVSADVRANVNLRIALRLRDAHDSLDVLDSPEAAQLPEGLPGRALLRTGADTPREVQVARVAGPAGRSAAATQVWRLTDLWQDPLQEQGRSGPSPGGPDEGTGQSPSGPAPEDLLGSIVRATRVVAAQLDIATPPSPWLTPLPERIGLADLAGPAPTPYAVAWATMDLPERQLQQTAWWQPVTDGHFAVIGSPRSGASTTLRTLAAGFLDSHDAGRVHLVCFDSGTGLRVLGGAPHTSAWVGIEDPARGLRVLMRLLQTVQERHRALAAEGLTSFAEQQEGEAPWPLVVWLVDGWGRFSEVHGEHARGAGLDAALRLLKEGPAVGVVAAVSGDRTLLTGRVAAALPQVWALRLADPTDLLLAGLSAGQIPGTMPPGRVIGVRDGVCAHVAVPSDDPAGAAQVAALRQVIARHGDRDRAVPASAHPWRVRDLPTTCRLADLLPDGPPQPVQEAPPGSGNGVASPRQDAPAGLLIGVGGDDAGPMLLGLDLHRGGTALVAGPPGSGRTTTLRTVAAAARAAGWATHWVDTDTAHDLTSLRPRLESAPAAVVCVDDVETLADGPVEDLLLEWAAGLGTRGGGLVVAADATRASTAYRGLVPLAARTRAGVLLCPQSPGDGAVLGVSAPTGGTSAPGRGVLVRRGTTTPVQVALPSDGPPEDVSPAGPSGSSPR